MLSAMSRTAASADVFHAIADGTRRRMIDLLSQGEAPVSAIVERFEISQPSISEHLRILREAGLVAVRQFGRQRLYRIQAKPLQDIANWVAHYEKFWDEKLDALGKHLEKQHGKKSS
jgi:DNA-binding transcriptional ArsR family regulator